MMQSTNTRRRWLSFGLRDIGFATTLCGVCLGWWVDHRHLMRANHPSTVFVEFNFVGMLADANFRASEAGTERTGNLATGRAQILADGVFSASPDSFACYSVYQLVTKRLNAATQGHAHQEQWTPASKVHPDKPVRICTYYNAEKRHGELQLWLFPNSDESEIHYVLELTEEPLQ